MVHLLVVTYNKTNIAHVTYRTCVLTLEDGRVNFVHQIILNMNFISYSNIHFIIIHNNLTIQYRKNIYSLKKKHPKTVQLFNAEKVDELGMLGKYINGHYQEN